MVFLEAESFGLIRLAAGNWGKRLAQPGDLPPGLNASRLPRAVNAHAPDFRLRHTASKVTLAFSVDMIYTTVSLDGFMGLIVFMGFVGFQYGTLSTL